MKKVFALLLISMFLQLSAMAETVVLNTNTMKMHSVNCPSAKKCTKNCIKIDKKEAIKQGAIPCQRCKI